MNDIAEPTAVDALAEAWASIDGKLDEFRRERDAFSYLGPKLRDVAGYTGHWEGYLEEAGEMIARLRNRGFEIVPLQKIA